MSASSYSIYGSCVTRDAFAFMDADSQVDKYMARTSLISQMSDPIDLQHIPDLSSIESNWQKKMIMNDFLKTGLPYEKGMKLIIDFVDERFQLLSFKDSLVTESMEFGTIVKKQALKLSYPFKRGTLMDEFNWKQACKSFLSIIKDYNIRVILHVAYQALEYRSPDNQLHNFPKADFIKSTNARYHYYYSTFIKICEPHAVIEVPASLRIGDESHKWHLAPFHFTGEYYAYFWNELMRVSN